MNVKPASECFEAQFARRNLKHNLLLLTYGGFYLKAIQDEKDFHPRMAGTFVAIHKRMIIDE
jgi:hypothetical protein